MRNLNGLFELQASLIGSINPTLTAVGAPIDTQGFKEVLATLVAGSVTGSNAATLAVKFQESSNPTGTGALWSDITNGGASNGSWDFDTLSFAATTTFVISKAISYERVGDGVRLRYIRAHATCAGTAGQGIKFSVNCLLGKPYDSALILNASTTSTGNVEFTLGR